MTDYRFILIHTKDLRHIPDYASLSDSTLLRRMSAIRDFVGKTPQQPVTVFDLATFLGMEVDTLLSIMTIRL